ncbi:hypothetical protein RRG08_023890 [Elysia crispata]|uniref:Uncharacterized protein n=1 Tax=Elysia crispata TaxID=231223 RepID=A0AAE1E0W3_9GAST|nr:hypothetical protein RRG08_023890 [Elysia crispata]
MGVCLEGATPRALWMMSLPPYLPRSAVKTLDCNRPQQDKVFSHRIIPILHIVSRTKCSITASCTVRHILLAGQSVQSSHHAPFSILLAGQSGVQSSHAAPFSILLAGQSVQSSHHAPFSILLAGQSI